NGGVVSSRVRECLHCKLALERAARLSLSVRIENPRVVLGFNDYGEPVMVFGSSAEHGRAANIDILDRILDGCVLGPDHSLEGIQINRKQVESRDAVLGQNVVVHSFTGEQARM